MIAPDSNPEEYRHGLALLMTRLLAIAVVVAMALLIATSPRCRRQEVPPSTVLSAPASPIRALAPVAVGADRRQLESFDIIQIRCPLNVMVVIGPQSGGLLQADRHSLDSILTDVSNRMLDVSGCPAGPGPMPTLQITLPSLRELRLKGPGNVTVEGLAAESFSLSDEGSGDITVTGRATAVRVYSRSSGNVRLGELSAEDVNLNQEGQGSVEIAMNRSLVADISRGGRLLAHSPYSEHLDVTVRDNSEINIEGRAGRFSGYLSGGSLQLSNLIVDDLTLRAKGASASSAVVNAKSADVWLEGSGSLTMSGDTESLNLRMNSGHASFSGLQADAAAVDVSGGGMAEVNVRHALDATVNGAGVIMYDGDAESITPHVHGSGKVIHR